MANGTYGTKKPAFITSNDVEIFYHYRSTRTTNSADYANFKKLDSKYLANTNVEIDGSISVLPGMYDLCLPLDIFGRVGFYTVYIKPKEILTSIIDVSSLAAHTDIRGIVINGNTLDGTLGNNNELVGYRVEYFGDDENNPTRSEQYRLITSSNKCEPVTQNLTNSLSSNIKYALNDSSNLLFCTLTPSSSTSFNSNSQPFIGRVGQRIALINTKFNPIMLEIEMTEHDVTSIATMLEGTQLRNLDNATITTFTDDGGIYHQAMYGTVTDSVKKTHHDFKIKVVDATTLDETETQILEEIKDNL